MDYSRTAHDFQSAECTNIETSFCAKRQTLLLLLTNYRIWYGRTLRPVETAFKTVLCSTCVFMGKDTKRCTGIYRAVSGDCITLYAVGLKFQKWDIDKKSSIQRNLQISGIRTTKCCYSPYFFMTQKLTLDTLQFIIDTIIS